MALPARKPPVKMERRDARITVRYTASDFARLVAGGAAVGEEVSRYIRRCSLLGDSVIQATGSIKATGV